MTESLFQTVFSNQWLVILCVSIILLASAEIGFVSGLRLHRSGDQARKQQIGGIQSAILALLGLLLGFTFAMSVGRYESRRSLTIDEANAIGTTYLRAALLEETHQSAVRELLRNYLEVRMEFCAAGHDRKALEDAERKSVQIQKSLWKHAVEASKAAPTPIVATFITALNETIDLDAKRLSAMRSHVPAAVWLLVMTVATIGCMVTGYSAGATGVRSKFPNIVLPLLIAVVITLVADLDRPRDGLITISQQPLIDLKQAFSNDS